MSAINPAPNDTTAARERAEAIRSGIDAITDALERVPRLIIEARKAEDWKALGYGSWQDYVTGEFGTSIIKLDKATRKTWAITLSEAGMSSREIAPVVNVSYKTVQRDLTSGTNVPAGLARVEQIIYHEAEADRLEAEAGHKVMDREEAEELTRQIRQGLGKHDDDITQLLRLGVPAEMIIGMIVRSWREAERQWQGDKEAFRVARDAIINPRLDALMGLPDENGDIGNKLGVSGVTANVGRTQLRLIPNASRVLITLAGSNGGQPLRVYFSPGFP